MKPLFPLTLLFFTLLSGCQSSGGADGAPAANALQTAPPAPVLSEKDRTYWNTQVSHFFDSTLLRGNFNGSILVAKEGEVVYENYHGYADLRAKDTLTANTPLQIASTSKTLTAGAILKLVQEGKLALTDSVQKFFPAFPYEGVTVKNLLNHRSGLPEYLYFMDKLGWNKRGLFATNTDVLNTLVEQKPGRASRPDTRFMYCNTNYVLLALIVEKVSGLPFPDYMQRNFFEPLGMKDTYVFTIRDTARATTSYNWDGSGWPLDFSDGVYGDKNVYSTPRDLLRWDQGLYTDILIEPSLLDSAYTPYSFEKPGTHNYGLGWRLLVFPTGKKAIYHNGRWHGFNSAFARLTDEKATIIILSSRYNRSVYAIARKLYNRFGPYENNGEQGEE